MSPEEAVDYCTSLLPKKGEFVSPSELAKALGVSTTTVNSMIEEGRVTSTRPAGVAYRIPRPAAEEAIERSVRWVEGDG